MSILEEPEHSHHGAIHGIDGDMKIIHVDSSVPGTLAADNVQPSPPLSFPSSPTGNLGFTTIPDLTNQVTKFDSYPVFEGTFSNVFKGTFKGTYVAIKVIRGVTCSEAVRRKLCREVMIWGVLQHRNIVPLYGYCKEFGAYGSLISPWYKSGDVGKFIRKHQTSALQRLQWLQNATEGLAYLHSHEPVVIHGDLKPGNILIDDNGTAQLCDFGLVRVLSEENKTGLTTKADHTGTIRYLSHELVEPADPDAQIVATTASDVHALGCIALEVLFLRSPYADCRHALHIYDEIRGGIPPATEIPVTGSPLPAVEYLWKTVVSCWNTDPAARPSAIHLQQYMRDHEENLKEAFGEDLILSSQCLVGE